MFEECELPASITITRILQSCCTAQWGTAIDVVKSCLPSSTPSSSHPLRETLMAGHSERTTVHSVACCCVIVVTGKSEDTLSIFYNDLNMLCLPRRYAEIKQLWNSKSGTFMLSRCAAFRIRLRKGLQVGAP